MTDTKVEFELVSPEALVFSQPVDMVVVPGAEGDFGVLPGHAPLISTVRPDTIAVHDGGRVIERFFVEGGFAEVTAGRCTVLAERAEQAGEIDRGEAEQGVQNAREDLADAKNDDERKAAARALEIAEARARAAAG